MTEYSVNFIVKNFHTGPNGLAYIPSLFNFIYEAAGEHCIEENVTVQDLNEIGLTWMLSRINAEFTRIPCYKDVLTIKTWPTGARGLYSCRDFLVTDQNGDECIRATSAWLTIDLNKRRVVRLPQKIIDMHPSIESVVHIMEDNFKSKLIEPENGILVDGFRADYSSLDVNNHVTSSVYIRWILDALPMDFHINKKLKKIEIAHKLEILPGETARAEYTIKENKAYHCIRPAGGGPANCIANTIWE